MDVPFTKMHGLGNDFMVIDNRSGSYELNPSVIKQWANRFTGIGFDQLLMVQEPSVTGALFDYRIFNANGDEVEHCGNGARCFARYVTDRNMTDLSVIPVNTSAGIITLRLQDNDEVTVDMGIPNFIPEKIPFHADAEHRQYQLDVSAEQATQSSELVTEHYANVRALNRDVDNLLTQRVHFGAVSIGNPHIVIPVNDVDLAPVSTLGAVLETHKVFPARINVGFMQTLSKNEVRLRVFERGVGETKACGTGACAAVAVGIHQGVLHREVAVNLRGGKLKIAWPENHKTIEMTGPCSTVFEGQTRM